MSEMKQNEYRRRRRRTIMIEERNLIVFLCVCLSSNKSIQQGKVFIQTNNQKMLRAYRLDKDVRKEE